MSAASPSDLAQRAPGGASYTPLHYEQEGMHTRTGDSYRVWQVHRSEPARAEIIGRRGEILWLRRFANHHQAHARLATELREREHFAPLPVPRGRHPNGIPDLTSPQPPPWHCEDSERTLELPPGQR